MSSKERHSIKFSCDKAISKGKQLARQQGVTLIELVISIVVLSIALIALINAMGGSLQRSSNILLQDHSIQLAQAYLDEILAKRYDETTPIGGVPASTTVNCAALGAETGENRATFDDVDDYDGLNDQPPRSQTSTSFPEYAQYRVTVTVSCVGGDLGQFATADSLKRIEVAIIDPKGDRMVFSAYRGNF